MFDEGDIPSTVSGELSPTQIHPQGREFNREIRCLQVQKHLQTPNFTKMPAMDVKN
jgi:hypothetical protein